MSSLTIARVNGIDPKKWLRETLPVLPTWKHKDLDKLSPIESSQKNEVAETLNSTSFIILDKNQI